LAKRTSINSNFEFHKEKEMAEFRRCLYALAFVALLAGLTIPASAQPFQCTNSTGVPPTVRAEGYAELVGDLVLDCTGGIPTPVGQQVPQVNIAVNLDTFVSSKVTKVVGTNTEFLESLIIIDEPNSASNPTTPIRNCGAASEDTTVAGPGICTILGGGAAGAAATYNGTPGHPNVFQGRSLALITGQTNQVVFLAVPIDPPGTVCATAPNCHRTIRITNIRGDASTTGVAQGNQTSSITAQVIVNPVSGLPIDNPSHVVARVQLGLVAPSLTNGVIPGGKFDFIQCSLLQGQGQGLTFTFREAFANAFKARSLQQIFNNGTTQPYAYTSGGTPVTSTAVTTNQNVPGATYDTESGFMNNNAAATGGNPPTNPLSAGPGTGNPFVDTTVSGGTGIVSAGIATQGTRLAMNFANVPTGATISVPNIVLLTNVINNTVSGVAVLINGTVASGSGGTPAAAGSTNVAGSQIPGGIGNLPQRAVYEIFFSNPGALEQMAVPLFVSTTCALGTLTTPCPNLPGNLPTPNSIATIQGGFAPSYAASLAVRTAALEGSGLSETTATTPAVLPVPRFQNLNAPVNLLSVVRCTCNLLFPFVTNAPTAGGNFDTGIAISNTSLDPGNLPPSIYGFRANPQSGPVQLWYYNRNATPAVEPNFLNQGNTQCTNQATPGSCSGTLANIPAGGQLTYVLSTGGVINGQTPGGPVLLGAPAFTGYVIAQSGFQYCHGFAFISRQGAGFDATNMAMGYLAIELDVPGLPRTFSVGENDGH
jgi:hypothetical protein